jgi:hypothetical protein
VAILLNLNQIEWIRGADPIGETFKWNGRFFRPINPGFEDLALEILNSKLFNALLTERMFVPTRIAEDIVLDGYNLILEHALIPVLTYPPEWSFAMYKEAAVFLLKLNLRCRDFGYELKGGHLWNILFQAAAPIFVGFGSIVHRNDTARWVAFGEFAFSYVF